jgi:simple sugar transport system ATP-binding protein
MLTARGIQNLGAVIRRLTRDGVAIIFITHKLQEAYDFGDSITMLRHGKVVGNITSDTLTNLSFEKARDNIVELLFNDYKPDRIKINEPGPDFDLKELDSMKGELNKALSVTDLSTAQEKSLPSLSSITFSVKPGEVFGIAGVDGNGQKQLAETLSGQRRSVKGRVMLGEQEITDLTVSERLTLGLTYITDDRYGEATVPTLSISTNALIKRIGAKPFWR